MKKFTLFLIFLLSACATNNGQYDIISSNPLSLYTVTAKNEVVARNVEASSLRQVMILIPLGKAPSISKALDKILKEYQGDYMTNVQISRINFQIMFWYQFSSWKIKGDVVRVLK